MCPVPWTMDAWCPQVEPNHSPSPCHGGALPLSYTGMWTSLNREPGLRTGGHPDGREPAETAPLRGTWVVSIPPREDRCSAAHVTSGRPFLIGRCGDDGFRSRYLHLDRVALSRLSYITLVPLIHGSVPLRAPAQGQWPAPALRPGLEPGTCRLTAGRSAELSYRRMMGAVLRRPFRPWRTASLRSGEGSRTRLSLVMSQLSTTGAPARGSPGRFRPGSPGLKDR
jgi:hypothetical protein